MEKKIILLENVKAAENNVHAIMYLEEGQGKTTVFLNIYGEENEQKFTLKIRDIKGNLHVEEFENTCKVFVLKNINVDDIISCNVYIDRKLVMVQKDASGETNYNEADFYLDIANEVHNEQEKIDREFEEKERIEAEEKKRKNRTLIEELGGSYEELFSICDTENILETIFKFSRFVRVPAFGKNYVAGLIYSNGQASVMCFGMPVFSKKDKPEELGSDSVFIPASENHKDGFGYYIVLRNVENVYPAREAI